LRIVTILAMVLMFATEAMSSSAQTPHHTADSLWEEGKFRAIVNLMQPQLEQEKEGPRANYWMCRAYLALADYDSASYYGEWATKLAPDSSDYHLWYGRALGMKLSGGGGLGAIFKVKKVKGAFQRAVELDSTNLEAKFDLMQYDLQAPGIVGGNKEEAFRLAEDLTKAEPALGHFAKAICYQTREEYDRADWEFRAATAYDTSNTDYAFRYFYFLLDREDYDRAEAILKEIEKIDPDDPNLLYQRGKLRLLSGKELEQGLSCFKEYLARERASGNPSYAAAHWRMGMTYEKMGRPDSARAEYRRSLDLDPDFKEAKESLKKLN
jgi:tetratricopeptide (TPR) repeat protein